MTYKTRQEVLRAAADWMDVCAKAGLSFRCVLYRYKGEIDHVASSAFVGTPEFYEFPIALLEGKEVWIGDELWNVPNNFKFTVKYNDSIGLWAGGVGFCQGGRYEDLSWNPPKPKTIFVELPYEYVKLHSGISCETTIVDACKKAIQAVNT